MNDAFNWLDHVAPVCTGRRLVLSLAKTAVRQPTRLRYRLNAGNFEMLRSFSKLPFRCNVCGHQGVPYFDMPDVRLRAEHNIGMLRETLQCRACGCTMRDRSLTSALLSHLDLASEVAADMVDRIPSDLRILDTDNHSPLSCVLRGHPGYLRSMYVFDQPNGIDLDGLGVLNVNLEDMPFEDASLDILLTSDVMEHVRDYQAANREIARCLKPGGAYIFNIPFNENLRRHRTLIDTSTDADIPLEPVHVHGDPVDGGIKAYRIYGRQIFGELEALGLAAELRMVDDPTAGIFRGDVFVAIKKAE